MKTSNGCDLLKIHYLCGDKYNPAPLSKDLIYVVICSKFITFAVTNTTNSIKLRSRLRCDLLKIHYLCGDKYNFNENSPTSALVVICSKFITFAVTNTTFNRWQVIEIRCDLLKIHYLCGDKYNKRKRSEHCLIVVICSKFITFAVTNTTVRALVTTWMVL